MSHVSSLNLEPNLKLPGRITWRLILLTSIIHQGLSKSIMTQSTKATLISETQSIFFSDRRTHLNEVSVPISTQVMCLHESQEHIESDSKLVKRFQVITLTFFLDNQSLFQVSLCCQYRPSTGSSTANGEKVPCTQWDLNPTSQLVLSVT